MARLTTTSTTSRACKDRAVLSVTKANLSNARARRRRGMKKGRKELKRALEESKRSPSTGAASPAELIPHPRGTPGRKDLQPRLKMRISDPLYKEIRGFVRILIKKSDRNRTIPFKHQRGDEVHKISTVAAEKYPVLNKFECNWVTAAMIQGCLKNFRGRTRRLALTAETKPNPSGVGRRDMGVDAGGFSRGDMGPGAGGGSDPSGDAAISRPPSRLTPDFDSSESSDWDIDID